MNKAKAAKKENHKVQPESLEPPEDSKIHADLEWIKNELQAIKDRLDRSPF